MWRSLRNGLALFALLLAGVAQAQTGPAPAFPHADGENCEVAGEFPKGVDEEGAVQDCTAAGGGASLSVKEDDVEVDATVDTIDFLGADFDVTESPEDEVNVALAGELLGSELSSAINDITTSNAGGILLLKVDANTPFNAEELVIDFQQTAHNKIIVSSNTGQNSLEFEGLHVKTDRTIAGGKPIGVTAANPYSPTPSTARGAVLIVTNTSNTTVNLPVPNAGLEVCIIDGSTTGELYIHPQTGDQIHFPGLALAVNDRLGSAEITKDGCYVCLVAEDATHWWNIADGCTWTDIGP